VTASNVLAHHLPDPTPADREELARLLKRELKAIDVHVVLAKDELRRFRDGFVTGLDISDGNRHFYAPGISIQKHDGINKMVLRRQDGVHVTIDPADYSGDGALGLDLGSFSNVAPLRIDVYHESSGWELVMKVHTFGQDCPEIEKGGREDLAFRAMGPNLENAYRRLRARGPTGDEPLDELLELLPMHLPSLRDIR
jgi:hypothetical protein